MKKPTTTNIETKQEKKGLSWEAALLPEWQRSLKIIYIFLNPLWKTWRSEVINTILTLTHYGGFTPMGLLWTNLLVFIKCILFCVHFKFQSKAKSKNNVDSNEYIVIVFRFWMKTAYIIVLQFPMNYFNFMSRQSFYQFANTSAFYPSILPHY